MKVYKAPEPLPDREHHTSEEYDHVRIFLGGSIEMGVAENWQDRLTNALSDMDKVVIVNPRRDDWDSSWVQDPTPGTKFREQVDWEIDCQMDADIIVYYFDPATKSPITLLELGMFGGMGYHNIIVCCPREFWRYGNVAVVCDRNQIPLVHDFGSLVTHLREEIIEMKDFFTN